MKVVNQNLSCKLVFLTPLEKYHIWNKSISLHELCFIFLHNKNVEHLFKKKPSNLISQKQNKLNCIDFMVAILGSFYCYQIFKYLLLKTDD